MCLRILLVFPRGGELQTPATGTYIWLINNSILVRKADRNTSSDDDVGAEVISFSNSVVDCEIPVLRVPDAVLTELAFAGASAVRGAIIVLSDVPAPASSCRPGRAGPVWAGPSRAIFPASHGFWPGLIL